MRSLHFRLYLSSLIDLWDNANLLQSCVNVLRSHNPSHYLLYPLNIFSLPSSYNKGTFTKGSVNKENTKKIIHFFFSNFINLAKLSSFNFLIFCTCKFRNKFRTELQIFYFSLEIWTKWMKHILKFVLFINFFIFFCYMFFIRQRF